MLASCKSLLLFVLITFSTSLVGKLWVCHCLGRFFCFGPFLSMWSFLWSSIRVHVYFVGIYSFLVLVCRELRWISWTRNLVFRHGQAFFSLIFFQVSFWVNRSIFPFSSLLRVLLVLLSYCHIIHSAFSLYFFGCHIFVRNLWVSFASGCWYVLLSSPPNCW